MKHQQLKNYQKINKNRLQLKRVKNWLKN
ncbi:hypothetical protein BLA29_012774 [Euroglyphus maynei]|uniref:Uncharacterized protein n=1 Tax=Euroglyphus maynei TaxID=6958 RepID=A0A1Y3BSZ6_EURMA|nr:hypothetical protein BLA29_012774 [Euroglyphus maynei]